MNYILHLVILIAIYSILAGALNLVVGYCGLLSLCHAAFFGLGAYSAALLMVNLHWPFWPAAFGATGATALVAYLIAVPCLRLRGDSFVLGTMGFQMIVFSILYNWTGLTRGPDGIGGISRPRLPGWDTSSLPAFCLLAVCIAVAILLVQYRLLRMPFGRALEAVRDNEIAALAIGKNVTRFRALAFMIAGGMAAVAGVLQASYVTFIDPTMFTIEESVFILSAVIVGGAGSLRGPLLGTLLVVLLPELLRGLHVPDAVAANIRQIIYGFLLLAVMRWRPQGLGGKYGLE